MKRLTPTFASTLASRLGERMLNLPPALTRDVVARRPKGHERRHRAGRGLGRDGCTR